MQFGKIKEQKDLIVFTYVPFKPGVFFPFGIPIGFVLHLFFVAFGDVYIFVLNKKNDLNESE